MHSTAGKLAFPPRPRGASAPAQLTCAVTDLPKAGSRKVSGCAHRNSFSLQTRLVSDHRISNLLAVFLKENQQNLQLYELNSESSVPKPVCEHLDS